MKVLVTGGTGFIGRKLVKSLLNKGYDVWILSRYANYDSFAGVHVLKADLTVDLEPIKKNLIGFEIVFHCAGEIKNIELMNLLHIDGTQRLLDVIISDAENSGRIVHWVQLSSVGAYGPPECSAETERTVTETTALNPVGQYEISKTQSDNLLIKAAETKFLTYTIVRPSNVFSKEMPNQSIRALGQMVAKGLFFYIGKTKSIATYVHVDDVVNLLLHCAIDVRAKGEVFNISNDCLLEEVITGISKALKVEKPKLRIPIAIVRLAVNTVGRIFKLPLSKKRINALVSRTRYPYSKLEEKLGFVPLVSVPDTIGEVVTTEKLKK